MEFHGIIVQTKETGVAVTMNVRMIQRGDRGLFIANGNKLLFPDRSWKDAREGFAYDVEIVLDKGTYAFVRGKMLETLPIELDNLMGPIDTANRYRKGVLNGQEFILEWSPSMLQCGYRLFVRSTIPSMECVQLPRRAVPVVDYLHTFSEPIDTITSLIENAPVLNFESDEQYFMEMVKFLRTVWSSSSGVRGGFEGIPHVYNSSIIIMKHEYRYSRDTYVLYRYEGELGKGGFKSIDGVSTACMIELWENGEPLDLTEISEMALDYRVVVPFNRFSNRTFDTRLSSHEFKCMNSGVVVYAFNMSGYDFSWFETEEAQPYIALVEESFQRLESLKFKLAKRGLGIDKLSDLNVRNWLCRIGR